MRYPWIGSLGACAIAASLAASAVASDTLNVNNVRPAFVIPSTAEYSVTDLGTLAGYQWNSPAGINDLGAVVTNFCCNTAPNLLDGMAAIYQYGRLSNLGSLPGFPANSVSAISNTAMAVGGVSQAATNPLLPAHTIAVAFTKWGIQRLGTLPGDSESYAVDVNHAGDAVGNSWGAQTRMSSVIFTHGKVIRLGDGWANGLNNSGVAIGTEENRAKLFSVHGKRELGTFVGPSASSYGAAINDNGVAVGSSQYLVPQSVLGFSHAFVAYADGIHDLGVPAGADFMTTQTAAYAINNLNEIVGSYMVGNPGVSSSVGPLTAFIYVNGAIRNLNTLLPAASLWTLASAASINNCGDIVGQGLLNGQYHGYLLRRLRMDHAQLRQKFGCRR